MLQSNIFEKKGILTTVVLDCFNRKCYFTKPPAKDKTIPHTLKPLLKIIQELVRQRGLITLGCISAQITLCPIGFLSISRRVIWISAGFTSSLQHYTWVRQTVAPAPVLRARCLDRVPRHPSAGSMALGLTRGGCSRAAPLFSLTGK